MKPRTRNRLLHNRLKSFVIACVLALSPLTIANAHEQAVAFTEVSFLPTSEAGNCAAQGCRIEVAHRLAIHDAESALSSVLGARADLVNNPEAQARFASYVAEHFALIDPETRTPLKLTLLGGEVERGYYWVYQEGQTEAGQGVLLVSQTVLMDDIPSQTNRVNLRHHGDTQTLVFNTSQKPKAYQLD